MPVKTMPTLQNRSPTDFIDQLGRLENVFRNADAGGLHTGYCLAIGSPILVIRGRQCRNFVQICIEVLTGDSHYISCRLRMNSSPTDDFLNQRVIFGIFCLRMTVCS